MQRVFNDFKWHLHIAKLAERLKRHSSGQQAVTPLWHQQLFNNSSLQNKTIWVYEEA